MSVDVEEYFQVKALSERVTKAEWESLPQRVESAIDQILELFAEFDTKATFFTLGWIAERHPAMIRAISAQGHEIASHGWEHIPADEQTRDEFGADIRRSKQILEDLAGRAVLGYRAASFSINATNLWALEELEAAGFRYSSSIFPVEHDIYGLPGAPRYPFEPASTKQLIEWPGPTVEFAGRRWNCGGGGYFRLLPYPLFRAALRRFHKESRQPSFFYFHPWEMDPEQPRITGLRAKSRFRHYLNLNRTDARLRRLLTDFRWNSFDRLLNLRQPD
jgi:polysaccharide deacetylase family protein (PEP-CTERM system associated)